GPFLGSAVHAVLGPDTPYYSLAIWHGVNAPLILSVLALVVGAVGYLIAKDWLNQRDWTLRPTLVHGAKLFENALVIVVSSARSLETLVSTRRLQLQFRLLVLVALGAGALPFILLGYELGSRPTTMLDPGFAVIWIVGGA